MIRRFRCSLLALALLLGLSAPALAESTISTLTVTRDTTFTKANGPYIISGTITVVDTVTLTIEAGAELRFGDNAHLQVNGSLQAVGTQGAPIVFTSSNINVFDGRWDGIVIDGNRSRGPEAAGLIPKSRLEWCDIGFGEYDNSAYAGLVAVTHNATPVIKNCTIHNGRASGLWIDSQYMRDSGGIFMPGPEIRDNTFRANSLYGLHLQSTHSSGSGNTALIDLAQEVPQRIGGNRYEGNGSDTGGALGVSLGRMTLARSHTWGRIDSQQVHVRQRITVPRFDRDGAEVQLTVPASTRIEFTTDLRGGSGQLYFEGRLQAVGTAEAPIEFVGRDRRIGEWGGLEFFKAGASAQLEHVLVQHANIGLYIRNTAPVVVRNSRILDTSKTSQSAAILVDGAEPTIENCELVNIDGSSTGIRIRDMRTIPTFKDNVIRGFGDLMILGSGTSGEPTYLDPSHLSRISGTTHSGNTRDFISLYHVTLLGDYTWRSVDGMEMRVGFGWLAVPANRTLIVPAGTTMRFLDSGWLNVAGTLEAVGTETEPIVFTTSNVERESGRWYGVLIQGRGASASRVEWCTFNYGGFNSNPISGVPYFYGLLNVVDSAPTIRNSTFRFGRYGGLLIDAQYVVDSGGSNGPTVENNTLADNEEFGLVLRSTVRSERVDLAQVVPQSIKGNIYLRNGEIARGYNNSIGLGVMALATSYSWGQIDGQDLDVVGPLQVPKNDLQGNPVVLTIPAGTRVGLGQTASTSGNGIGHLIVYGELEALGTVDERIALVGLDDERRVWNGVYVRGQSAKARLAHCEIVGAGYSASIVGGSAGIFISDGADVEVRNVLLRGCYISVQVDEATPLIENCEFRASVVWPVRILNAAFMPTLSNSTFRDNSFKSLIFIEGGVLAPADLGKIAGSQRINNAGKHLTLNNVSFGADYVWQDQVGLLDVALEGTVTIPSGITLTVPSGSHVRFWNNGQLNVVGTLEAIGTGAAPIHFTSANAPDPATGEVRGLWYGVGINGGAALAQRQAGNVPESRFEWCVFSDGQGVFHTLPPGHSQGNGLLNIYHASPSLRNITFRNSLNAGLYVEGRQIFDAQGDTASTAMPAIEGGRFTSNTIGMTLREAMPQMVRSAFVDNSAWGVQNLGNMTADASGNWWGSTAGPTHASIAAGRGDKITDKVVFANWLQETPDPVAKPRPEVTGLIGDVDGNGRVTIRDALIVAAFALNADVLLPPGADIERGDADGDGRISLRDALVIATYVVDPTNENLPPWIATKPALMALGQIEAGDRVQLHVDPDAEVRGYSLCLEWDAAELELVSFDEPAAFAQREGRLTLADLGSGQLQPLVLEFEARQATTGALRHYSEALTADLSAVSVQLRPVLPQRFALLQNHPNPFNPATMIRYSLPGVETVSLKVYNAQGQLVRTLVEGEQAAGAYDIQWDGRNTSGLGAGAGLYFYELEAGSSRAVRKMLLLK